MVGMITLSQKESVFQGILWIQDKFVLPGNERATFDFRYDRIEFIPPLRTGLHDCAVKRTANNTFNSYAFPDPE